MKRKSANIDLSRTEYTLVFSDSAEGGTGYCLIKKCPVSMRADLFEYCAYKLFLAGAKSVLLGVENGLRPAVKKMNFSSMDAVYESSILHMSRIVPEETHLRTLLRLEPVKSGQTDQYKRMYNRIFTDTDNVSSALRSEVERNIARKGYEVMFAVVSGEKVGLCEVDISGDDSVIETVGIDEEFRGQGFSRMVLQNIFNILNISGVRKTNLIVSSANKAAFSLYKSEGFRTENVLSKWYRLTL